MCDVQIPINDSSIKLTILSHIIQLIDQGGIPKLIKKGMEPSLIDNLRFRCVRDVVEASELTSGFEVDIRFDTDRLRNCFDRIDTVRKTAVLKEYFITLGASADLINTLFKLSKNEVTLLRQELATKNRTSGRTLMPALGLREQIQAVWADLEKNNPTKPTRRPFL